MKVRSTRSIVGRPRLTLLGLIGARTFTVEVEIKKRRRTRTVQYDTSNEAVAREPKEDAERR